MSEMVVNINKIKGNLEGNVTNDKNGNDIFETYSDKSLSNLNDKGKKCFFPSNNWIMLTVPDNRTSIVSPANGYFYLEIYPLPYDGKTLYFSGLINVNSLFANYNMSTINNDRNVSFIPAKKDDVITIIYDAIDKSKILVFKFIFAEGEID